MDLLRRSRSRVVITGLGAITSLGSVRQLWSNLTSGRSGVRRLQTIETTHVPVKIGGEVQNFDPLQYMDSETAQSAGRASQFAVAAAQMALADAGLQVEDLQEEEERVSVVMGTTLGAFEVTENEAYRYRTSGYLRPSPYALLNALPCMPAHYVSHYVHAYGPINTVSSACASGTQSIGEAFELVRNGRAEVAVAGGVESILKDYTLAGFDAMNTLANGYDDHPEEASRPFDADRSGFVLSEGCGMVILESLEHALKRGAPIYAEVVGYASSSDAFHAAAPEPDGKGAARAIRWALEDACLNPEDIQYINAHGTATPTNDSMETRALKRVFGAHAYRLAVSSAKSMLGHAMGGSGAIEAVICAMSLKEKTLIPTINLRTPDPECDLDYVPNTARRISGLRNLMSNSFGLGGQNASLVLSEI